MSAWNRDEVIQARHLFATGLTWRQVGDLMGRTGAACRDAVSRHFGSIDKAMSYEGPPIGKTMECERTAKDAKLGSQILLQACLDLFQRTANRYQIGMSDAMACHLGYHAPPRIVRSPASLCGGRLAA